VHLLGTDGALHPVAGSAPNAAAALRLPDGRVLRTSGSPEGHLDAYSVVERTVGQLDVPAGVDLGEYDLATLSAGAPLDPGDIMLTDAAGQGSRSISAAFLGLAPTLGIRVGSCPQWHGYDPHRPLYVIQDRGTPVTTVTLSGLAG
jgi:hypothetical protein